MVGITSKLDYFVESGIGAIWLSPINRSPMIDFGYDISDFKDIDERFGTLTDFENLIKRAKEIGLKVSRKNKMYLCKKKCLCFKSYFNRIVIFSYFINI